MIRYTLTLVILVALSTLVQSRRCPAREDAVAATPTAWDDFPAYLMPLVSDLDAQLRLTYASSRPIYHDRVQYTLEVVAAWQASGRTPDDELLLEDWIRDAVHRSIPGRREPLAGMPAFSLEPSPSPPELSQSAGGLADSSIPSPSTTALPLRREMLSPPITHPGFGTGDEPTTPAIAKETIANRARTPQTDTLVIESDQTEADTVPKAATLDESSLPSLVHDPLSANGFSDSENDVLPTTGSDQVDEPRYEISVEFNLREYAARLVGHRRGIRRLEARLLEADAPMADELAEMVGELESLASQAAFLHMYANLLPEDIERLYGRPVSAGNVSETLQKRIAARRAVLSDGTPRFQQQESVQLAGLADRINQIAELPRE